MAMKRIQGLVIRLLKSISVFVIVGPLFVSCIAPPALASTTTETASVPRYDHIVLVMLENRSYNQVVGSKSMPYLNSLIKQGALATNYYANVHPSIGNYFMLTTGKVVTRNDTYTGTSTADNIARELTALGKSWKSYDEGLPYVGYLGGNSHRYLKRHNPFAYFSDVRSHTTEAAKMVPFTQFASDLVANALPDFSLIVPDACNDAHDCGTLVADAWLKKNLAPLLKNSDFMKSGLLVITFDEGKMSDKAHGGGHDPVIMVGTDVKAGYKSTTFYQHQNLFKTFIQGLGITRSFGAPSSTSAMSDVFRF